MKRLEHARLPTPEKSKKSIGTARTSLDDSPSHILRCLQMPQAASGTSVPHYNVGGVP